MRKSSFLIVILGAFLFTSTTNACNCNIKKSEKVTKTAKKSSKNKVAETTN